MQNRIDHLQQDNANVQAEAKQALAQLSEQKLLAQNYQNQIGLKERDLAATQNELANLRTGPVKVAEAVPVKQVESKDDGHLSQEILNLKSHYEKEMEQARRERGELINKYQELLGNFEKVKMEGTR